MKKLLVVIGFMLGLIQAQYPEEGDVFFKGLAGYGFSDERVFTKIEKIENGGNPEKVYIYPGGGLNINIGGGVHLTQTLILEADFSYHYSGDNFENGEAIFRKYPLSVSILHGIYLREEFNIYGGLGGSLIFGSKYMDQIENTTTEINYKLTYAAFGKVGFRFQPTDNRAFFFGEASYIVGKKLNAAKGELDGIPELTKNFAHLGINGIYIGAGIGYYY
jgi:hypothetical protein